MEKSWYARGAQEALSASCGNSRAEKKNHVKPRKRRWLANCARSSASTLKIGAEVYRTRHQYAEMSEPIELIFFAASADPAQMRNLVFEQIQWRSPRSLADLNFLPADRELIEKLANGTLPSGPPPSSTPSRDSPG